MIKFLLFSLLTLFHPVHVTLTSIDYIREKDALQVFVKLYYDDFLLECSNEGRKIEFEGSPTAETDLRLAMEKYLNDKIIIRINDKKVHGLLKNMSIEDNEARVDLEYYKVKKPGTISVRNIIMTDLFSDQANMVIIKIGDFEQGVKLTPELKEQTFKIK